MLKFLLFSCVAFMLHEQTTAQFSFQNAWKQYMQKLESMSLPPITIGNFELIPAGNSQQQSDQTEDSTQGPTFDYDELLDVQVLSTPAPELPSSEPIQEVQILQVQATEPSQIRQTAETSNPEAPNLMDFVVQKLTSIETKIDNLQEELRQARETIQQQNQQLQQCTGPIQQEDDLSAYARIATTPAAVEDVTYRSTTPSQSLQSVSQVADRKPERIVSQRPQSVSQIADQSREIVQAQYPTLPPYPQLHLSQQSLTSSTTAQPAVNEQESQWFRDHSIVQVHGNPGRYSQSFQTQGQQVFMDSSEELQGQYVKG